jgi:hypothetical protein
MGDGNWFCQDERQSCNSECPSTQQNWEALRSDTSYDQNNVVWLRPGQGLTPQEVAFRQQSYNNDRGMDPRDALAQIAYQLSPDQAMYLLRQIESQLRQMSGNRNYSNDYDYRQNWQAQQNDYGPSADPRLWQQEQQRQAYYRQQQQYDSGCGNGNGCNNNSSGRNALQMGLMYALPQILGQGRGNYYSGGYNNWGGGYNNWSRNGNGNFAQNLLFGLGADLIQRELYGDRQYNQRQYEQQQWLQQRQWQDQMRRQNGNWQQNDYGMDPRQWQRYQMQQRQRQMNGHRTNRGGVRGRVCY